MTKILDKPPDEALAQDDLIGCFGRREMEIAAKCIIKKAVHFKTWLIPIKSEDFSNPDYLKPHTTDYSIDGFHELFQYGWIRHNVKNPHPEIFEVTPDFVTRLKDKRPQYFPEEKKYSPA